MRTTLDIADDILLAAKDLARREKTTAGAVISALARKALNATPSTRAGRSRRKADEFLGFRPFPSRGGLVTNDLIDKLRDEDAC